MYMSFQEPGGDGARLVDYFFACALVELCDFRELVCFHFFIFLGNIPDVALRLSLRLFFFVQAPVPFRLLSFETLGAICFVYSFTPGHPDFLLHAETVNQREIPKKKIVLNLIFTNVECI